MKSAITVLPQPVHAALVFAMGIGCGCQQQAEMILARAGSEIRDHDCVRVSFETYEVFGGRNMIDRSTEVIFGPHGKWRIDTLDRTVAYDGRRCIQVSSDPPTRRIDEGTYGAGEVMALGMVAQEFSLGYARLLGEEWWREAYGHDARITLHPSERVDGRDCYVVSVNRVSDGAVVVWWIEKRRGVFYRCEQMRSRQCEGGGRVGGITYRLVDFPPKIDDRMFRPADN